MKSVSGVAVTVGNSTVSWFSSTQKIVTLSTTEAEYVALGDGVKEGLLVKAVLSFIVPSLSEKSTKALVDNEGPIKLAANPLSSARTKHIDVRFHFIRELVRTGMIAVEHIPTLGGLCPKERGSLRSLVFLSSPLVSSWSRGYCGHFLSLIHI